MSRKVKLHLCCALSTGVLAGAILGCQTYDFQPVPLLSVEQTTKSELIATHSLEPNVMLLVDKSQSMDEPADPTNPNCLLGDGGICGLSKTTLCDISNPTGPTFCPTRWWSLQTAISGFLTNSGNIARFGMATFPSTSSQSDSCGGGMDPNSINTDSDLFGNPLPLLPDGGGYYFHVINLRADIPASDDAGVLADAGDYLASVLGTINSQIVYDGMGNPEYNQTPWGGTPTGVALLDLSILPSLQEPGRKSFVLLMTDGTPNCDPYLPTDWGLDAGGCACTAPTCAQGTATAQLGCLDGDGTVQRISALADGGGIYTIVVGFGADTEGAANAPTLNAMAIAGGYPRLCPAAPDGGAPDAGSWLDCDDGGNPCNAATGPWVLDVSTGQSSPTCTTAYYSTASEQGLATVLGQIGKTFLVNPCEFDLPSVAGYIDPSLLVVSVGPANATNVPVLPEDAGTTWYVRQAAPLLPAAVIFVQGGAACTEIENSTPANEVNVSINVLQEL